MSREKLENSFEKNGKRMCVINFDTGEIIILDWTQHYTAMVNKCSKIRKEFESINCEYKFEIEDIETGALFQGNYLQTLRELKKIYK